MFLNVPMYNCNLFLVDKVTSERNVFGLTWNNIIIVEYVLKSQKDHDISWLWLYSYLKVFKKEGFFCYIQYYLFIKY